MTYQENPVRVVCQGLKNKNILLEITEAFKAELPYMNKGFNSELPLVT
jgi:hypothetical protein